MIHKQNRRMKKGKRNALRRDRAKMHHTPKGAAAFLRRYLKGQKA